MPNPSRSVAAESSFCVCVFGRLTLTGIFGEDSVFAALSFTSQGQRKTQLDSGSLQTPLITEQSRLS